MITWNPTPAELGWSFPQWKQGNTAQATNPAAVQKQRCFNLLGRKIGCVQDEARFRITPGMLAGAAVLIYLVGRR